MPHPVWRGHDWKSQGVAWGSLPGGYAVRPQCHVRSSHDPFLIISFRPPFFLSFSTVCPISIT